jgi:hypothetical protein
MEIMLSLSLLRNPGIAVQGIALLPFPFTLLAEIQSRENTKAISLTLVPTGVCQLFTRAG